MIRAGRCDGWPPCSPTSSASGRSASCASCAGASPRRCHVRSGSGRRSRSILRIRARRTARGPAMRAALQRGDCARGALRARRALRRRAARAFPINSRDVGRRSRRDPASAFPAAAEVRGRARRLAASRPLRPARLSRSRSSAPSPDWHCDAVHRRQSPRAFWAIGAVSRSRRRRPQDHLGAESPSALAGARAGALRSAATRASTTRSVAQLSDWLAANPPLIGTNWASMLELGFRSPVLALGARAVRGSAQRADREPVDRRSAARARSAADAHRAATCRTTSARTRISRGGAGALRRRLCAARARARAHGASRSAARSSLAGSDTAGARRRRARRAVGALPPLLHRLLSARGASARSARDDPAAPIFEEAARRQARYLRTICDDDGDRPQIGDDDGGQLFPICGPAVGDCRDTLANAAIVAGRAGAGDRAGARGNATGSAAPRPREMRRREHRTGPRRR